MTYKKDEGRIPDWIEKVAKWSIMIIVVLGMIGAFVFFFTMFRGVDVGHAVILVDPRAATTSEPILGPTWIIKAPWVQAIDIYYAMTSTEMWTDAEAGTRGEYPAVHVLSKDGLDIEVDMLIRYQLDSARIKELYQKFPDLKWEDRVISSIVREDVRDVVSQYLALEIIEQRELISNKMRETIYESLIGETSLQHALLASSIEIDLRDIDPPLKFKQAIEAKLTAEQQKIQAEFERDRILILADAEAKQKVIYANGTAEAMRLIKEEVGEEGWNIYYSWQQLQKVAPYVKVLIIAPDENGMPIFYTIPGD